MSKKSKKLIKKGIIFIIITILAIFFYTKYYNVHTNYCCEGLKKCGFFTCSELSSKLREFQIFGLVFCFFGAMTIVQAIDILKSIFSDK